MSIHEVRIGVKGYAPAREKIARAGRLAVLEPVRGCSKRVTNDHATAVSTDDSPKNHENLIEKAPNTIGFM